MGEMTPASVAAQLGELSRQLDTLVTALSDADRVAVNCREDYTLSYARAFLAAEGSAEHRKQLALVATHTQRLAAETADQVVRGLRRSVDSTCNRIDVGRTISATARSEAGLSGTGAWGK